MWDRAAPMAGKRHARPSQRRDGYTKVGARCHFKVWRVALLCMWVENPPPCLLSSIHNTIMANPVVPMESVPKTTNKGLFSLDIYQNSIAVTWHLTAHHVGLGTGFMHRTREDCVCAFSFFCISHRVSHQPMIGPVDCSCRPNCTTYHFVTKGFFYTPVLPRRLLATGKCLAISLTLEECREGEMGGCFAFNSRYWSASSCFCDATAVIHTSV